MKRNNSQLDLFASEANASPITEQNLSLLDGIGVARFGGSFASSSSSRLRARCQQRVEMALMISRLHDPLK
jgi:hypothetical protein